MPEMFNMADFQQGREAALDAGIDPSAIEQAMLLIEANARSTEYADAPHERLGMQEDALIAALRYIANSLLECDLTVMDPEQAAAFFLVIGIITGVEWQEMRHA